MFLVLSLVTMIFSTHGAFADTLTDFDAVLAGDHKHWPESCQIRSPQMRLAYACSPLFSSSSRFHKVRENDRGVNFCFNSFVDVRKNGNQLQITVLRDVGGNIRRFQYTANESELKKNHLGEYVVSLDKQKGGCFAYTEKYKQYCSKGFLGFGDTDIPMTLNLKLDAFGSVAQATNIKHDEVSAATQLRSIENFDKQEVNSMLINSARSAMASYAQEVVKSNKTDEPWKTAFNRCYALMEELQRQNPVDNTNPEDDRLIQGLRGRLNASPSAQPGGAGEGRR